MRRTSLSANSARLRILIVVGTRPEAIKLAMVANELARFPDVFEPRLCLTAQHRELLDQVLPVFGLRPDHDLDLMRPDQTLEDVTAALLIAVGRVIRADRTDLVLVVGDTTTGLAASLAAFYERVPVGHIEAGLRTYMRYAPYPEEIFRRVISPLATFHFAPTPRAVDNLWAERQFEDSQVHLTGNPVVDSIRHIIERRAEHAKLYESRAARMLLVTAHRRENFGAPLRRICGALRTIVDRNEDAEVVYPVHPNPNVRGPVHALLGGHPRIHLLEPQDYIQFAYLMADSHIILTDSGGIQEEAPVLAKPVLVMREVTERPEAIEAGTAVLVGSDEAAIVRETERLLRDEKHYARMARTESPFGDGHAAERIVQILREELPKLRGKVIP